MVGVDGGMSYTRPTMRTRFTGFTLVGLCARLVVATLSLTSMTASVSHAQQRGAPAPQVQPAATPESVEARERFQAGQLAYNSGDYEQAAALWEEAYRLDPRPALQYNLAQAYSRLGRLSDELAALTIFVDSGVGNDATNETARARMATLHERIARTGVRLVGADASARLSVDGAPQTMPEPDAILSLPAGTHRLRLERTGYHAFGVVVNVSEGEVTQVSVTQDPVASRTPGYVLLAAGGGVALVGATLGTLAFVQSDGVVAGTNEGDKLHAMALSGDVLMGVGAAALVTGLVMLVVTGGSDDDTASIGVAPTFAREHVGLTIGGTF